MRTATRVSPPSTRSRVSGAPRSVSTSVAEFGDLRGDALQDREHQVPAVGGQRHPGERRGGVGSPPRGRQTGQCRHAQHAAGVGRRRRRRGRAALRMKPRSWHPADRRGGGVDLPVDAVGGLPADPPGHRGGQPGGGAHGGGAGVGQQERAGAEGALRLSGVAGSSRRAARPAGRPRVRRRGSVPPNAEVCADDVVVGDDARAGARRRARTARAAPGPSRRASRR